MNSNSPLVHPIEFNKLFEVGVARLGMDGMRDNYVME